jgi:hypothetical protein
MRTRVLCHRTGKRISHRARERISYNSSHGYKYKEIKRGLALPLRTKEKDRDNIPMNRNTVNTVHNGALASLTLLDNRTPYN